jgi:hypothetical protein
MNGTTKAVALPFIQTTNGASQRQNFPLGQIVTTPRALAAMQKSRDSAHDLIMRQRSRPGIPIKVHIETNIHGTHPSQDAIASNRYASQQYSVEHYEFAKAITPDAY